MDPLLIITLLVYIIGACYLAKEDLNQKSIRFLDGVVFLLVIITLTYLLHPEIAKEGLVFGVVIWLFLYLGGILGFGDIFIIIPTTALFGYYIGGLLVLSTVLISVLIAMIKKREIPYIPVLFIGVISWQLLQLSI